MVSIVSVSGFLGRRLPRRERVLSFQLYFTAACSVLFLLAVCTFSPLCGGCEVENPIAYSQQALLLAFYFPQYHPIPENDRFWGPNFTEWTNVARHRQLATPYHDILLPAPEIGNYNLLEPQVRSRQAQLARQHKLDGFIYYHYWFGGKPVMDQVLEAFLRDGQPNVSFALCWANEPWTKRWDGGTNEVLLPQEYKIEDAGAHYTFLKRFWAHPLHVRRSSDVLPFFVYRISHANSRNLSALITLWRQWARRDGLGALHIVELFGYSSLDPVPSWVDAVGEFWPLYKNVEKKNRRHECLHRCHYPGTFVSWNNSPRHTLDGRATTIKHSATTFGRALRKAIHKSASLPPDCFRFVLVSSWNEWGEGNVLEPDVVHGTLRLHELSAAVHSQLPARNPPELCVVARTYGGHENDPFYNVSAFVSSLRATSANWRLLLVLTDVDKDGFASRLQEMFALDSRVNLLTPPEVLFTPFDSCLSAYHVTDWAIRQCPASTEWVIATNSDNTYGALSLDSLASVSDDADMFILASRSRYHRWNFFRQKSRRVPDCAPYAPKNEPLPSPLMADLGQVALRYRRLMAEDVYFSRAYPKTCQAEDRAIFSALVSAGWQFRYAPLSRNEQTYFMHNPNPDSCRILGGVWRDSADFSRFTCVQQSHEPHWAVVDSYLGPFKCSVDFLQDWANVPAIQPTAANIIQSQEIARRMMKVADGCGLRFDSQFYAMKADISVSKAEEHWKRVGFVSGRPYRWRRTQSYHTRKWVSDTCFLFRAIAGNVVISDERASVNQCWARTNRSIFRDFPSLLRVCTNNTTRSTDEMPPQWCWEPTNCFVDACKGCIYSPAADHYVAYTCGFAVNRVWITSSDGWLCAE